MSGRVWAVLATVVVVAGLLVSLVPGLALCPFLLLLWPAKPLLSWDDELKRLLTEGVK